MLNSMAIILVLATMTLLLKDSELPILKLMYFVKLESRTFLSIT